MNFRKILLGALALGLAGSALADDNVAMKMSIAVVDGAGEKNFTIDSDNLGFDLHDMQEGESRSIVDEAGQAILITRTSDGFSLNIDGETIDLPSFDGESHGGMMWSGEGGGSDVDVHVIHDTNVATMVEMDGTMIISAKPIDATTQQAIKDLLGTSGYSSDVNFIDRDAAHNGKVMIKKVEMTVENPQT